MSFENETLRINSSFKESGVRVSLPIGSSAFFEYFIPSNITTVPDDQWEATISDPDLGDFFYDVLNDILTVGTWRIQPYIIKDGNRHTGDIFCLEIEALGGSCPG